MTIFARRLRALGDLSQDRPVWRRFRRNFSISLAASGLTLAIRLGQTALLTRALKIDDYGRVLIALNLFLFLETFVGLRVSDVMYRFLRPLGERGEERALQGLLLLCVGLSLATGLLIGGGAFFASPWIAARLYHDPRLAPLFKIYGCTVFASAFREFYEPVLRLNDRFASVVVPHAAGGLLTLALLAAYFAAGRGYDLNTVMAAFAVGGFVQAVPALALALRLLRPALAGLRVRPAARALTRHRPELMRCLFHSNLSGYLRFALNPGDVFLLGLFSTPAQVALYGLARQMTAPLAYLQINAQTAIAPEVIRLITERKFPQLKRLVERYVVAASLLGVLAVSCGLLLGRRLISLLSRPDYLGSLPVFYVVLVVASVMLAAAVFYPLKVGLDLLRWHNLGLLASASFVIALAAAGRLDAITMAYAQLAGAVMLRFACNVPAWLRLRALAADASAGDVRGAITET